MSFYFGQNFLVNEAVARKIINLLDIKAGDLIIEIGPGKGALTLPLLEKCEKLHCRLIAVEKDAKLIAGLRHSIGDGSRPIEIVEGDALRILPELIRKNSCGDLCKSVDYKLIGNIPYYITGKLLRILSELEHRPELIILTFQKEVAQRIVAQPLNMNLLAAITQFWSTTKIEFYINRKEFMPMPKVDSAVVKIIPKSLSAQCDYQKYFQFIRLIFKYPRKTLYNNLKLASAFSGVNILELLKSAGYSEKTRASELSLDKIIALADHLLS